MALKSDRWIRWMAEEHKMIDPFAPELIREGVISFGLSSYGYDIRLSNHFKLPGDHLTVVDPKNLPPDAYTDLEADICLVPPGATILARSIEYFRIPRNVTGLMTCKSTYARVGVIVPATVLEAGWEGFLTIGVINVSSFPVKVYANEGISQVLFFEGDEPCDVSYADRKGKYQAQDRITPARL